MDKASWGGVILGLGGIVGGLLLEGGNLSQVLQPTAAMIVFGGTAGAVLIQFPLPVVGRAVRKLVEVFLQPKRNPNAMIACLADCKKAIPPLPCDRLLWKGEPLEYFLARVEALAATA